MLRNLVWGVKWGLWYAAFFAGVAVVLTAVTGGEIVERQGLSLAATIGFYFLGGLIGGAVLGLLRPLAYRRVGAIVVGIIVMTPVSALLGLLLYGPVERWDVSAGGSVVACALILGGLGGDMVWEPRMRKSNELP